MRAGWIAAPLLVVAAIFAVLSVRALRLDSRQPEAAPVPGGFFDADTLAARLAGAVRIPTVSGADAAVFRELHRHLEARYPRVFSELTRIRGAEGDTLPGEAILLEWAGSSPELPPILLLAHLDVVPAGSESTRAWSVPPFEGRVEGGYVWGRGTLDDKGSVIAVLEAVESLLAEGFRPERGVLLGFGHDEETGGRGAEAMARVVARRSVRLAFVLDEGYAVTHGYLPGVAKPVALVGIAEKGAATVELRAVSEGGHSAMPPARTAPGLLAEAVAALETRPMPSRLDGPSRQLFEHLAPEMSFPMRLVFANLRLFDPLVRHRLAADPGTDASVRTTTAITRLQSGVALNVLPVEARAAVNFRILPGETTEDVMRHVRSVVDTSRIEVRLLPGSRDPSPVSDPGGPGYRVVADAIRGVFPEALVVPGLVLGGTDSRHFAHLADATLRFVPVHFRQGDGERLHGIDERVPVSELPDMVRFYRQVILGAGAIPPGPASPPPS